MIARVTSRPEVVTVRALKTTVRRILADPDEARVLVRRAAAAAVHEDNADVLYLGAMTLGALGVAQEIAAALGVPVIVGGGYAGLAAALELARSGAAVAVVEANEFGRGASTRNGGAVSGGVRLAKGLSGHGGRKNRDAPERDIAALLASAADSLRVIEAIVAREKIECFYERTGNASTRTLRATSTVAAWPSGARASCIPHSTTRACSTRAAVSMPRCAPRRESARSHGSRAGSWSPPIAGSSRRTTL